MTGYKPGSNSGRNGGVFQEIGPRGGARPNYTTVPDNHRLPPTTTPGSTWKPTHRTPNSDRWEVRMQPPFKPTYPTRPVNPTVPIFWPSRPTVPAIPPLQRPR